MSYKDHWLMTGDEDIGQSAYVRKDPNSFMRSTELSLEF